MHLLIVHQNFVDHRHPGGTRHLELAKQMVRNGHRCTIIAGRVDYLTGKKIAQKTEVIDGVEIRRSFAFATVHKSYVGRALSYISFTFSSIWTGLTAGKVDVVFGTSPPLFQLASAWMISKLRRRPFVLEIRDLWPEFPIDMGILKNKSIIRCARIVESFFYRQASFVVANSPGFENHLLEKGVPKSMLATVPNGVDSSMFDPQATGQNIRQQFGLTDEFLVTYSGAMGAANNLGTLIDAAEQLKDHPKIRFLLVGGGKLAESIAEDVKKRDLTNVILGGVFPKEKMKDVLAASNVCVASLQNIRMFRTVYPNKVFDYMAAGRPTLLLIDGVIREVIEKSNGGRFITPGDPMALAQAIRDYENDRDVCTQQGESARKYVEQHFERASQANHLEGILLDVVKRKRRFSIYGNFLKRAFDLSFAAVMGVLLLPVFAIVAILIRFRLGSPVIFRQPRAGLNGRIFTLVKFRSMTDEKDADGNLLSDEVRLTSFGKLLRKLSLDELPQLWNVFVGDMSLIGPRPLLTRYLERYSPEQARRHEVRPGITGWAQVNGRNSVNWEERFKLDVWYVENCRFAVDLRIVIKTIGCLVAPRNVNAEGSATMTEFMGSEKSCS